MSPQRMMEDGTWYDLDPPANVGRKVFRRVVCEYQVPNNPNEYSVRGIPDGGSEEEPFILRFTPDGKVRPMRSANQASMRLVRPDS
jgi:hypothetical protein